AKRLGHESTVTTDANSSGRTIVFTAGVSHACPPVTSRCHARDRDGSIVCGDVLSTGSVHNLPTDEDQRHDIVTNNVTYGFHPLGIYLFQVSRAFGAVGVSGRNQRRLRRLSYNISFATGPSFACGLQWYLFTQERRRVQFLSTQEKTVLLTAAMDALYPIVSPRRSLTDHPRGPISPRRLPRLPNAKEALQPRSRRQFTREHSLFRVAAPTQYFQRPSLQRSDTDVVHQRPRVGSLLGQVELSDKSTEVGLPHRRRFPRLQPEPSRSLRRMPEKPEGVIGPAVQRQLSHSHPLPRSGRSRKVVTPRKCSGNTAPIQCSGKSKYTSEPRTGRLTMGLCFVVVVVVVVAQLRAKFRRLARFVVVLLRLWRSHALKVDRFLRGNVNLFEIHDQGDLMFDKSFFQRKVITTNYGGQEFELNACDRPTDGPIDWWND
ncbi:hypothetical protein LSAT2_013905, partial [Lamellibrachia satsuma]